MHTQNKRYLPTVFFITLHKGKPTSFSLISFLKANYVRVALNKTKCNHIQPYAIRFCQFVDYLCLVFPVDMKAFLEDTRGATVHGQFLDIKQGSCK